MKLGQQYTDGTTKWRVTHSNLGTSLNYDDRYSLINHNHDNVYSSINHNHDDKYASKDHGNHVPTIETANNAKFLRNDNTWQLITPNNIGAATTNHTHDRISSSSTFNTLTIFTNPPLGTSGNNALIYSDVAFTGSSDALITASPSLPVKSTTFSHWYKVLTFGNSPNRGFQVAMYCYNGNNTGIYYRNRHVDNSDYTQWGAWKKLVSITPETSAGDSNTPVYVDASGTIQSTGKSFANYAPLNSPTFTGNPTIATTTAIPRLYIRNTGLTHGTAPSSSTVVGSIEFQDKNGQRISTLEPYYRSDGSYHIALATRNHTNNTYAELDIGVDKNGNNFVSGPTPANLDNSNKLATTNWVVENANKILTSTAIIFVSKTGTGDGTTAAKAMSLTDLYRFLSVVKMYTFGNTPMLYINFVPAGSSYGELRLISSKMPGVNRIAINTSTGVDTTTSNYTTNAPLFDYITIQGPLEVELRNVEVTNYIQAMRSATVNCYIYIGTARFIVQNYAYLGFSSNIILNIHNQSNNLARALFDSVNYGNMQITGTNTTINFRELCYYRNSIFYVNNYATMSIYYTRYKITGTKPIVLIDATNPAVMGTCSTAAGTAAKAVTLDSGQSFTLTNNATICIKFTNSNTANNPTLNVNNTGAKPIYWNGAAFPANYIIKDFPYRFVYNSSTDQYVCTNDINYVENTYHSIIGHIGSPFTTYNNSTFNFTGYTQHFNQNSIVDGYTYGGLANGVTATTQASTDNSTKVATTAFVKSVATAANCGGIVAASLNANGYVKFANGFILQWGRYGYTRTDTNWTGEMSLPIACTTICYTAANPESRIDFKAIVITSSKSTYNIAAANTCNIQWIGMGY